MFEQLAIDVRKLRNEKARRKHSGNSEKVVRECLAVPACKSKDWDETQPLALRQGDALKGSPHD